MAFTMAVGLFMAPLPIPRTSPLPINEITTGELAMFWALVVLQAASALLAECIGGVLVHLTYIPFYTLVCLLSECQQIKYIQIHVMCILFCFVLYHRWIYFASNCGNGFWSQRLDHSVWCGNDIPNSSSARRSHHRHNYFNGL
jgi:hypothetical protein